MSTATQTVPAEEERQYVTFNYDGEWGHKREILKGDRAKPTFTSIPLIDVSGLHSDSLEDRRKVAQDIVQACNQVGFFYIKGHGIDQALIDATVRSNREYFAQPDDVKMQEHIYKSRNLRGYEPVHGAQVDPTKPLGDRKESFLYSYEAEEDPVVPSLTTEQRALLAHNLWPADNPAFRQAAFAYDKAMLGLCRKLMKAFALGLGEDETYFDAICTAPNTSVKKIHYPPQDVDSKDETGIGAHTDFVCFTILFQDEVGGLEVLNANAEWVPATPIPGTFVVNIGDFLMRTTNDQLLSTVHRVTNVSGRDRDSMPFFFCFNMDAFVEVLPSCCSAENPAKYTPITVSDYYKQRHERQKKSYETRLTQ